jgi:hypothetical protein
MNKKAFRSIQRFIGLYPPYPVGAQAAGDLETPHTPFGRELIIFSGMKGTRQGKKKQGMNRRNGLLPYKSEYNNLISQGGEREGRYQRPEGSAR